MDTSPPLLDIACDLWPPVHPPLASNLHHPPFHPSSLLQPPHLFPSLPSFDQQPQPGYVLPSLEALLPDQAYYWQPKCELPFSHLPPLQPSLQSSPQTPRNHTHLHETNQGLDYLEPKRELFCSDLPPLLPISGVQSSPKPPKSHTHRKGINTSDSGVNTHNKNLLYGNPERPIKKGSSSYREAHIYSERQRRQGMSSLFTTLKSLLPPAQVKSDRCTILTYVIEYVHSLKKSLQQLGKMKAELLTSGACCKAAPNTFPEAGRGSELLSRSDPRYDSKWQASTGSEHLATSEPSSLPLPIDVTVSFWSSADLFITLNCPKKKGLWPELLSILETQNVDVENVTLSTTADSCFHCIYAKVPDVCAVSCDALRAVLVEFMVTQLGPGFHGASDVGTWRRGGGPAD